MGYRWLSLYNYVHLNCELCQLKKLFFSNIQRDFKKAMFSRCMLYRHNAVIGTDWNLFFWDNSLYYIHLSVNKYWFYKKTQNLVIREPVKKTAFLASFFSLKITKRMLRMFWNKRMCNNILWYLQGYPWKTCKFFKIFIL